MSIYDPKISSSTIGITGGFNYDGGDAYNDSRLYVADGDSSSILPPGASAEFKVDYAIIAVNKTALRRVNLTFKI